MNLRDAVLGVLYTAILWLGVGTLGILGADAFEFESTGECTECVLLPVFAERFRTTKE
jgi:hypothetical protein